ncbi:MAG: class I SAM-dependent methyltransferase [Paracoccaceae bacterium]
MNTQNKTSPEAQFDTRTKCITCESEKLRILSSGRYTEEPLHGILCNDPVPSLRNASWTFVQCEDCDQKFHRDILNDEWQDIQYNRWITKEAIEQFYKEKGAIGFEKEFKVGKHAYERMLLLEKLTRDIRGDEPVRVLDFGCGEGLFLATCACSGFETVGVEFSTEREENRRVDFYSNLDQVAKLFEPASFDAITLFQVLEHLAHPLEVLRELSRFTKKGGVLILETPDCESVTDIKTRRDVDLIGPLGHINAFTAASQERIAKEVGFKRISPSVVQCTSDMARVYKREARRYLQPFLKRTTQQVFVKES